MEGAWQGQEKCFFNNVSFRSYQQSNFLQIARSKQDLKHYPALRILLFFLLAKLNITKPSI